MPALHIRAQRITKRKTKNKTTAGSPAVFLVRIRGFEPPPNCSDTDLNRARLPVPPYPHDYSIIHYVFINSRCFLNFFQASFQMYFGTRARRKPGSVSDNHLSRHTVSGMLQRPTFRAAAGSCPAKAVRPFGLAPDGVCTKRMLPYAPVSSYLTSSPLPRMAAVCFCCTFPIVTYAGRYPASSPYGARTFLMTLRPRDCLDTQSPSFNYI